MNLSAQQKPLTHSSSSSSICLRAALCSMQSTADSTGHRAARRQSALKRPRANINSAHSANNTNLPKWNLREKASKYKVEPRDATAASPLASHTHTQAADILLALEMTANIISSRVGHNARNRSKQQQQPFASILLCWFAGTKFVAAGVGLLA